MTGAVRLGFIFCEQSKNQVPTPLHLRMAGAEPRPIFHMITIPLTGNDKYTAIAKMKIADAIGKQEPREIAIYTSHCTDDSNTSLVVMARRIPYHVDAWEVHGPEKDRLRQIDVLTRYIQTAFADLKAASNGN